MPQTIVTQSLPNGREGDAVGSGYGKFDLSLINVNPQSPKTVTVTITAASNNKTYTIVVQGISISYLSDGTATEQEIADGLAAALTAEPALTGLVYAVAGTNAFDIVARAPGLDFSVTESDAQISLSVAASTLADPIPFGRAVAFDSANVNGARVLANALFSPRAVVFTPVAVNSTYYAILVSAGGVTYTIAYTSDGTATEAEITAGLDAAADGISALSPYLVASNNATTLTLTARPGADFEVLSVTPAVSLPITSDTQGTSLVDKLAGVAVRADYQERAAVDDVDGYGPNATCSIRREGQVRVYSEDATSPGGKVFVRVSADGSLDEIGRFRATAATGCVPMPGARWVSTRDGDNLAVLQLNL